MTTSNPRQTPRRKKPIPRRVYIFRRIKVAVIAVLWIVAVTLSVIGESHALFPAQQNSSATSAPTASASAKKTAESAKTTESQKSEAQSEKSEKSEKTQTPAEQDAKGIAALEASISDSQRTQILEQAKKAAQDNGHEPVTLQYCVATNGNVGSVEGFDNTVFRVLNNTQGWPKAGVVFEQTNDANACEFTVTLAEASKLPEYSSGCSTEYSCRVGVNVIINKTRWDSGVEHWLAGGHTLSQYRTMVINHEVGHMLGHVDNENVCEGTGKPAPLMQEQSMDLRGCVPNAWPLDKELWTSYTA